MCHSVSKLYEGNFEDYSSHINSMVLEIQIDPNKYQYKQIELSNLIELTIYQCKYNRNIGWWQYADLGMMYVLANDLGKARNYYDRAISKGADKQFIEPIKTTHENLRNRIIDEKDPVRKTLVKNIDKVIMFLNKAQKKYSK